MRALPRVRWSVVFAGLLLAGLPLAQSLQGQQRGQERRNVLEQRVRERFSQAIKTQLELTDEELQDLGATLDRFQAVRADLAERRRRARTRVRLLGQTDLGGAELTDEAASTTLAILAELADAEARLFQDEQNALLEILTPSQVLLFTRLRDALNERIRRQRQNSGGAGPQRGGLGPPPGGGW